MEILTIIINDSSYGGERPYNALKLAIASASAIIKGKVNVFLLGDAVVLVKKVKNPWRLLQLREDVENTYQDSWKRAKEKSGIYLRPKAIRDFFSQELGKAFVPDRYIEIFQGRTPKNVLVKHYTSQGIKMLNEIYEKTNLKINK